MSSAPASSAASPVPAATGLAAAGPAASPPAGHPAPGLGAPRRRSVTAFLGVNPMLLVGTLLGLGVLVVTIFNTSLQPYNPTAVDLSSMEHGPSWAHLLGTDAVGRDELSRVLSGFPYSIGVAAIGVAISSASGTLLGLIGAAFGGWPRFLVRRAVDFGVAFPFLVVAVVIIVIVGHGFLAVAVTLGIVSWPIFTRVVFAQGLVAAEQDYVLAARLMGVGTLRRALRHILPAVRGTVLVMVAFVFADLLLLQAALAFIGLGPPLGSATWGNMLADAQDYLTQAPWMLVGPAAAIVIVVVTANLIGEGLVRAGAAPSSARRGLWHRWQGVLRGNDGDGSRSVGGEAGLDPGSGGVVR